MPQLKPPEAPRKKIMDIIMKPTILKLIAISAGIAVGATGIARADCESDLGLLEAALAQPNLKPDAKAVLDAAGVAGASALRKDDDDTCHKVVVEALAKAGAAPAPAAASAPATAPLGDLAPFKAIAVDTLKIVKAGDLAVAKTRIKDLEAAWDKSAKTLKAANLDKWNVVDKAIDKALKQLRAASPTVAASADSLTALIGIIDKST